MAERSGIPSVSLVCEGFIGQAKATALGLGVPELPLAKIPGHIDLQSDEELTNNIVGVTLDASVKGLTETIKKVKAAPSKEPGTKDVVFRGTFEEVNEFYYKNEWSDGLPIIPPTGDKIEEFLRFTDLPSDKVIGMLLPANRKATVWNAAVNGVMAGCRPEYMPVLIALVEAMADPQYGVEHSGNTPGAETLIIINGPIIKDLGFNYEQGALRDGFKANTSIGRFWRLYLRNVAGFLLHKTDKGTFGNTWRVVLAENEDAVTKIGWEPTSVDMGFKAGENIVTISRYTGGDVISSIVGTSAEEVLPYIADHVVKQIGWELVFTVGIAQCTQRPHLILTPIVAETISKSGYSKGDVKRYLYEHARLPAKKFEDFIRHAVPGNRTLCDLVNEGAAPKQFCESKDPNRLVPMVCSPDDFLITVSGDPLRSNGYVFVQNGILGYPTSKRIILPANWDKLLK